MSVRAGQDSGVRAAYRGAPEGQAHATQAEEGPAAGHLQAHRHPDPTQHPLTPR